MSEDSMPSKRMVPEQEVAELSDEMVRRLALKDEEIARWKRRRDSLATTIAAITAQRDAYAERWRAVTRACDEALQERDAVTEQRDRAMKALRWAFPLANMAMENHRQERLRCGHRFGTKRIGLYDEELQEIEDARAALDAEAAAETEGT